MGAGGVKGGELEGEFGEGCGVGRGEEKVAAVGTGDFAGEGEAEAVAAGAAGGVATAEAGEEAGAQFGGEAGAGVGDAQFETGIAAGEIAADEAGGVVVADGVVEEVEQEAAELFAVAGGGEGGGKVQFQSDAGTLGEEGGVFEGFASDGGKIDGLAEGRLGAGVEAGEEEEILGDALEAGGGLLKAEDTGLVGGREIAGVEEAVELTAHDGEGRAKLVGGIGGEAAGLGEAGFEAGEHGVEDVGETLEFVAGAGFGDALIKAVDIDGLGGAGEFGDGGEDAAGEPPAADGGEAEEQETADEVGAEHFLKNVVNLVQIVGDDEAAAVLDRVGGDAPGGGAERHGARAGIADGVEEDDFGQGGGGIEDGARRGEPGEGEPRLVIGGKGRRGAEGVGQAAGLGVEFEIDGLELFGADVEVGADREEDDDEGGEAGGGEREAELQGGAGGNHGRTWIE